MLLSQIFDRKPLKDGIIDISDVVFSIDVPINIEKIIIVPEKYNKRPDLVCVLAYNTDEYTHLLMKYNNISNPLSISSGTMIIVPNITELIENSLKKENNTVDNTESLKNAFLSKLTEKEKEKIQNIVKQEGFTPPEEILPTFVNPTPDIPQVSVKDGVVRFGAKILSGEESLEKCGTPVTKAEWLTALVKNKIKIA